MAVTELGILAGNRNLPFVVAEQARKAGVKRIVGVGFVGETVPVPCVMRSGDDLVTISPFFIG